MKTVIKKCLAFVCAAGLMMSALTVQAGGYSYINGSGIGSALDDPTLDYSANGYYYSNSFPGPGAVGMVDVYTGIEPPATAATGSWFYHMEKNSSGEWEYKGDYAFDGTYWVRDGGGYTWGNAPGGDDSNPGYFSEGGYMTTEEFYQIRSHAEAIANQNAALDAGFSNVADMYKAAEKNMSAGEYYNNAVTSTPGIENATPVGQGGNLIVNGEVTNMAATISKVNRTYVDSVRAVTEGAVLNVVDVQFPALEATINFYMPGVTGDAEVIALQYANGTWTDVEITEIRADHVVLNLKQNGIVAFIQK
ncbi:MAG: hypothetical protein NC434_10245 [Ruminococcus sp.]|nr:hypothetical protein [Ruminococcus sp.]